MSTRHDVEQPQPVDQPRPIDKAQYGLAVALALIGAYVVYDASTLQEGFSDDPLGPRVVPYLVGLVLVLLGVLLAISTARGDHAEAEDGEDIDLEHGADWMTVAKLVGVFVFNLAFIDWLGWAITGALLFFGCTVILGSTTYLRNLAIGVVLSVGTWYGFYVGLGVPIPPGILDGVL